MLQFFGGKKYLAIILSALLLAPAVSFAQVSFVKDFDQALKQAAKEKKFVVLDISASW